VLLSEEPIRLEIAGAEPGDQTVFDAVSQLVGMLATPERAQPILEIDWHQVFGGSCRSVPLLTVRLISGGISPEVMSWAPLIIASALGSLGRAVLVVAKGFSFRATQAQMAEFEDSLEVLLNSGRCMF
jgi:hypothetical protein